MSPVMKHVVRCLCVCLVIFSTLFLSPASVFSQGSGNPIGGDTSQADYYSTAQGQEEIEQYKAVIDAGCGDPSLECLVHNVTRFVAIEWIHELKGAQAATNNINNNGGGGSNSNTSPYTGAMGGLAHLIGNMYTNPAAHTGVYVADVLESANIAQPAYAQGLGFAALDPVLEIWKTFRNIAYMFFVVIFIVIGFMIMFRQKISGQTAVTVQQAIPSVVISLIFVTFSYAIAGFMIDMMYVVMFLMLAIFKDVGILNAADGSPIVNFLTNASTTDIIDWNIFQLGGALIGRVNNFGQNYTFIEEALKSVTDSVLLQNLGAFGGGLTISLILIVAMLIGMIKLFFELLRSYATVVLAVVVAPLMLMVGAIPGKNAFMPWLRTIVGNLLPFPTVLMGMILFLIFNSASISGGAGFAPPFLLGASGGTGNVLAYMMGMAIVLALPEIVKKMRDSVAPQQGFGELIMKSAADRFKEGQSKIPVVKNITGPGAIARGAGRVGLGAVGAGLGAKVGYDRSGTGRGAAAGALIGGGIGSYSPEIAKRGAKFVGRAVVGAGTTRVADMLEDKMDETQATIQNATEGLFVGKSKQAKDSGKNQNITDPTGVKPRQRTRDRRARASRGGQ